jgi:hypothetical protein
MKVSGNGAGKPKKIINGEYDTSTTKHQRKPSLIQSFPPSTTWHRGEKECDNWPCVWHECEITCVDPQAVHRGLRVLVRACECENNWVWVWASCTQAHVGIIEAALDPMCVRKHRWENVVSLSMIIGVQMWTCMRVQIQMWVQIQMRVQIQMWMWMWMQKPVQMIVGVGHCTRKHASACVDRWHGTHANWVKRKSGVNDRGWTRIRPQQRGRTEGDEWTKGGDDLACLHQHTGHHVCTLLLGDGWDND